jgi:uncharacterized membrane protein
MRWLLIALLVSLAVLLIAAAGGARYIWLQRARLRAKPAPDANSASRPAEQSDVETEP